MTDRHAPYLTHQVPSETPKRAPHYFGLIAFPHAASRQQRLSTAARSRDPRPNHCPQHALPPFPLLIAFAKAVSPPVADTSQR